MTNATTLKEIRNEYKNAPRFASDNTHEAFIVKIYYSVRKYSIGVNYWTKEEAAKGIRMMDNNKCEIIEPLYKS